MPIPVALLVTVIINVMPFGLLFSSTKQVTNISHKSVNPETFNIKTVTTGDI